ncbi:hypothetical protein DAPPUDRAFT_305114 [Daphnia pulex]|uniref:Major facilitator superfamily (MFS) profile domain-containing protein n=1 Tax=Daphnia pulex TaxID=6669 RepID=E9GP10_DAPPU|nr:hypothetical protein DAPPUDRAFT_305114 [Daphnia pulex]|eukprot:EFX78858.1 hypothetical protein DAPPUDRAFT_305114 [Daphnia pulex]
MTEKKSVRRRRFFSLGVVSFTAFIFNLSFSIILTSAKPYLDKMDPEAGTDFLGLFIAAQPLAQLIFSPIMGYLGNKLGSIRILSMISMSFLAAGFALYACVAALPEPRRWYLFAARFLIGAAGGSITLCFSYIATATTTKERTMAVSLFQMAQSSAFVVGPAIQAAFAPLGSIIPVEGESQLYFDMYTGPAWLSVILAIINVFVFLPCMFTEYNIAREEGEYLAGLAAKKDKEANKETPKLKDPDVIGLVTCIIVFASVQFNFIFLESVATLLTMEMLGWDEQRAIVIVGIGFACAGLYSGLIFSVMAPTSRKVGERVVMLAGILFLLLGPVALYPYNGPPPQFRCNGTGIKIARNNHWPGCPNCAQPWCETLPAITSGQMITGFALIVTGFPMGASMGNAIFSKILGPFPQGTWMGILGAGACLARVLCPISVTNLYSTYGTWYAFGFMTLVMAVVLVIFLVFYKHLVPYKYDESR